MNKEHTHFVEGCKNNNVPEKTAEEVWDKMVKFASYAFNRSHAACYAYIGYITAYLSCHYPVHFYSAMLNAFSENADKVKEYLAQAKKRGITILAPDVNLSDIGFTPVANENAIRFGLKGIGGIKKAALAITLERENGPYKDMVDFYQRLNSGKSQVNKSGFENLIFSGAFDSFGESKKDLIECLPELKKKAKEQIKNQIDIFSLMGESMQEKSDSTDYNKDYLLEKEFDAIGVYISGHPAKDIKIAAQKAKIERLFDISEIYNLKTDSQVATVGIVRDYKIRYTKNGDQMLSFKLLDEFQDIKCVVFPKDAETNKFLLSEGAVVLAMGTFNKDEDFGDQLVVKTILSKEAVLKQVGRKESITIIVNSKEHQDKLFEILERYKGDIPVYLKGTNSEKIYQTGYKIKISPAFTEELSMSYKYY